MTDESLLPETTTEAEVTTTETTTETTVEPWYVSEGVTGEGDKPEFMLDKYSSLSDQAAAYPELASKFGGFTGAPEEYKYSMPDGIDGEIASDDPLFGEFQSWAKENNLNQDGFTNILHMFVKNEHASLGQDRESELAAIGDNAESRLKNISDYARANLNEDEYNGLLQATTTAEGVKAVEALIAQTKSPKLPDNSETVTGITRSELKERIADPRYQSDPDFRKETDKMYERVLGTGEHRTLVG